MPRVCRCHGKWYLQAGRPRSYRIYDEGKAQVEVFGSCVRGLARILDACCVRPSWQSGWQAAFINQETRTIFGEGAHKVCATGRSPRSLLVG